MTNKRRIRERKRLNKVKRNLHYKRLTKIINEIGRAQSFYKALAEYKGVLN